MAQGQRDDGRAEQADEDAEAGPLPAGCVRRGRHGRVHSAEKQSGEKAESITSRPPALTVGL